jgi:UDP-N-acetylmuramyl pentapeptide phosphotransferase/UDP-N-acetylglucosamine-1-phosphate transferase
LPLAYDRPGFGEKPRAMDITSAATALLVFLATLGLAGRVRDWLLGRAILDRPVERSTHAAPVPRGGGLAVVPVLLAAWVGLAITGRAPAGDAALAVLAGGLALVSWIDDLRSLPPGLRLLCHILAVAAGLAFLPQALVFQGLLPPLLDRAATVLLWIWFLNLFNFMDGIDGITGVETASLGLGMVLTTAVAGRDDGSAGLALATAAAALAFLRWNWHPARLFLGDVGSVPLGYLLGALLLGLAARGLWAPALILPLYYLADASVTLARRVLRGERFWQPHRQHFYQRALAGPDDHAAVARLVLAADAALVLCALLAVERPWTGLVAGLVVVVGLLGLMQRRSRRRGGAITP